MRAARLVGAKIGGVLSPGRVVAIGTHPNRLSHPSVTDAGQIAVIGVRVPVKTDRL
ncbi:MAG: hypothetical protein KGQ73_04075 [Gammaproteobacteria bacterium]|nr:hypothetical protein [Gammaproteobacteria bacterium]